MPFGIRVTLLHAALNNSLILVMEFHDLTLTKFQNKLTKQNKLKNPTKQNNSRKKTQTQVGKISTIKPQQKRTKKPIPTTTRKTRQKATFENTFFIENMPKKVGEPSAVEKLDSFLDGNPLKPPRMELSDSD